MSSDEPNTVGKENNFELLLPHYLPQVVVVEDLVDMLLKEEDAWMVILAET